MPNSPTYPHPPIQSQTPERNHRQNMKTQNQKRICDFCGESTALLYCRADSAKLCFACDREVHSTNQLFTKHTRWQLCDVCDSSPASIFCFTERLVLCQNCDFESHNSVRNSLVHDRRPLEGFNGCPSLSELSVHVGFVDVDCKSLLLGDEGENAVAGGGSFGGRLLDENNDDDDISDLLFWGTPAIVSIDELIVSSGKDHMFQAVGVPPLPKDRNLSCGLHKQEIIHQLRQLAKSDPSLTSEIGNVPGSTCATHANNLTEQHMFGNHRHHMKAIDFEKHEFTNFVQGSSNSWHDGGQEPMKEELVPSSFNASYIEDSAIISDRDSDFVGTGCPLQNPVDELLALPEKVHMHEFPIVDRDSAISRYKEKKRTRRYDKHIRYESRKVLAEGRTRVKGRFAKLDHADK
nr:COL4 [Tamarix hispida]